MEAREKETDTATVIGVLRITPRKTIIILITVVITMTMIMMMRKRMIFYFLSGIGEECPKSTEYCFLESGQPDSINDEKWAELCEVMIMILKMMKIAIMMMMIKMIKMMKSTNFLKTIISRMPGAKRAVAFARKGISA